MDASTIKINLILPYNLGDSDIMFVCLLIKLEEPQPAKDYALSLLPAWDCAVNTSLPTFPPKSQIV